MAALRSVLAFALLAVFAVGGVVLPSVHRAAHAVEIEAERDAHLGAHRDGDAHVAAGAESTPLATAPCAPLPNDVDCAVCSGISAATGLAGSLEIDTDDSGSALDAYANWVQQQTAWGTGARAPPIG